MFPKYTKWRRQRKANKVKPGDGHLLKPFRIYQGLSRSLFYASLLDEEGNEVTFAVDIHYFSEKEEALLYQNGKHAATSKLPGVFPVPGGFIETEISTYGLKRMHFVTENGEEKQLYPDPISAEGLRLQLDRRFPGVSRWIGASAVFILLASVLLCLPQLIGLVFELPIVQEYLGTFEAPFILPACLNSFLVTAGILAAIERALSLRNHWLIDMETSWWDEIG
jgi:hypothetical protein